MAMLINNQTLIECLLSHERRAAEWALNCVLEQFVDLMYHPDGYDDRYVRMMRAFDDWAIVLHRDDCLLSPVIPSVVSPDCGYVLLFAHLLGVTLDVLEGLPSEAPDGVDVSGWVMTALSKDFDRLSEGMDGYFLSYEDFGAGQLIAEVHLEKASEEPYFQRDVVIFTYSFLGREQKYNVTVDADVVYVVFSKACRQRLVAIEPNECYVQLRELLGLCNGCAGDSSGDEEVAR